MTVPFDRVPLHEQRDLFRRLVDLGYTDAWSAETEGYDAFTPLALASVWAPELRLGTAIVPAFTRGPAVIASSAAALADAAPGRFALGIGASSDVIVERWNGGRFEKPYEKVRDLLRFLRTAFAGEKAGGGFRLGKVPDPTPPILVAALREGMLRLAGREGDGAILNWLSAEDVRTVAPIVQRASPDGSPKEVVARIFVAPTTDIEAVRAVGRRTMAAYLNVPVYAAFHDWLGRGELLQPMWSAWRAGDRQGALEAVPEGVIDEIYVHGTPEACREHIQRYIDNGVTTPMLAILPIGGVDPVQAIADLAPR